MEGCAPVRSEFVPLSQCGGKRFHMIFWRTLAVRKLPVEAKPNGQKWAGIAKTSAGRGPQA